ncbi:DUF4238 domain-containing protein [Aquabacter sp. P-9]|uniref:DUF4238 domain-containing protein n=1 Tax=Aquabacter sediminis TaxID=3029197 RepID=UPI00237D9EB7|nr:DUF4238 domain-containing protein [Aquabacter sp. P-9]MDE1570329.1 DUF4238 domain-containing protein [Aquabacter sp. P-9]
MSKTRQNHYVPQWYQEGFFEPGRSSLAFVDMTPERKILPDGRVITQNGAWNDTPTSKAFVQKDLYSTFFGASVNDEIERRLFGDIDGRGSQAVRAFCGTDVREWHKHFQTFFEYLDIQKIRTPKGLDWLKAQYPKLSQNELMYEMQGIRMMHCTIWVGGVREIVSAESSDVKFIFSDHPVTIYNHAVPPTHPMGAYPLDPDIALRASQTIFPLNRDFCLILSNLEYAKDPSTSPLQKRTFARNYRQSMTRIDAFIRSRKLTADEVVQVNFVLKSRARRYIGGGRKEWLYPEKAVSQPWGDLRKTFLPPGNGLFHFGGEMFVQYESGHVHYQDEFGRTEKPRDFLIKAAPKKQLGPREVCGCGSGNSFKACCQAKPEVLRPSWSELSIRERNIMLQNGIVRILGLDAEKDWTQIRREITDEKIKEIYFLYEALWPLETDLLALLPKPDGVARAVYTGSIHPSSITDFALAASLYFGELIVAHPFIHSGVMAKEYRPTANPKRYRQDVLKSIMFFMTVMPLVQLGLVNLIPDPCDFDFHLREQMLGMAQARAPMMRLDPDKEPRLRKHMEEDTRRSLMLMPPEALRRQLLKLNPQMSDEEIEATMRFAERKRELDPLAVLQDGSLEGEEGGQMSMFKLAPNFEMTMYLAQATGASIVTDSPYRWSEVKRAIRRQVAVATPGLAIFSEKMKAAKFDFPQNALDVADHALMKSCGGYPDLFRNLFRYLSRLEERGAKPNREAQFVGRFIKIHAAAQSVIKKSGVASKEGRISCVLPPEGIQDNTINRLLLMSSSERHLSSVPIAFFIENFGAGKPSILAR